MECTEYNVISIEKHIAITVCSNRVVNLSELVAMLRIKRWLDTGHNFIKCGGNSSLKLSGLGLD